MEYLDSVWQIGIIALLIGLAAGILGQRLLARSSRETEQLRQARDSAQQELKQYRESVNQHFDKTSELVNDLTHNYVRVYQHLAEGAQTLGDSKTLNNLLEQQPGRVSIALDENTRTTPGVAPESIVAAAPAAAADEHAEAFNTAAAPEVTAEQPGEPAAALEQPGEPAAAAGGDEPGIAQTGAGSETPEQQAAAEQSTAAQEPSEVKDAKAPGDGSEPVLNVDALDVALEKSADQTDATAPLPEDSDKAETRATTH
ncbi:MAG: DUF1043 family protein [Gammaproteobacteria bacterium]|nr:DUF1043 family protein [Gammaproteobacteria bacterium]